VVAKEVPRALDIQKKQMEAEYARIEQIKDENEKIAAKLRLKIVNEVLTLRCPRCKTAFVDFDGCFALGCGKNNCHCGFCAWCLKDCGDDAHLHVAHCSERQAEGLYHSKAAFDEHHRKKRARAVQGTIQQAGLSAVAAEKLRDMLRRDLSDLKIPVDEVFLTAER
jgi:hypothetical protein